ncbi:MAG: pantoate--beta-alanine ligase [Ktedonobacteraceae bacterium]
MRIIHDLDEMTETARGWLAGGSVGFVPTMGYLHEGHLTLVQAAHADCEVSVVSIFVNSIQFDKQSDYLSYPRDLTRDLQVLSTTQVDAVFIPRVEDMYPSSFSTYVTPSGSAAERLEAISNLVYVRGFATIMTKLFQLVRPDVIYFGQKGAQQVAIVRQLVRDLNIDVNLRILPTVRDSDGIAMSSRNFALTSAERQAARSIYQALLTGKALIERGERQSTVIEKAMADVIAAEPLMALDYAAVCNSDTFDELAKVIPRTMLALAVRIDNTRLIDNIVWLEKDHWLL